MISSVSQVTPLPDAGQNNSVRQSAPPKTQSETLPQDTVKLSQAAQSAQAIQQELHETSVQTAQEAAKGDIQAKHLLAREAADRA